MLSLKNKESLLWDALRFLFAGGFNTLLTLAVYQFALFFVEYSLAYAISWIVGISYLLLLYPTKVFPGSSRTLKGYVLLTGVYLLVFFIGLKALDWIIGLNISAQFAIFIVLVISTVINFVLMRLILRGKTFG